jgi:hypothetical protein
MVVVPCASTELGTVRKIHSQPFLWEHVRVHARPPLPRRSDIDALFESINHSLYKISIATMATQKNRIGKTRRCDGAMAIILRQ